MHFNLQKTQYLIIGCKGSDEEKELKLSSAVDPAFESVTDLGLIIVKHLKWGCHVKTHLQKSYCSFLSLKRNLPINTAKSTKIDIYRSFIVSAVIQASEVWMPSKTELKKLELFQKRADKWFSSKSNYIDRLRESKLLPVSLYLLYKGLTLLNKIVSGGFDFCVQDFIDIQEPTTYPLRRPEKLQLKIPEQTKKLSDAYFFVRAAWAGNYIQQKANLDVLHDHLSFKPALKKNFFYLS